MRWDKDKSMDTKYMARIVSHTFNPTCILAIFFGHEPVGISALSRIYERLALPIIVVVSYQVVSSCTLVWLL